ncbi:MAG: deoxyribonuclease IV [Endomicrobiales bacterium]|nr:deoxyribonuclease IV [Endomicrobiales bacterium]
MRFGVHCSLRKGVVGAINEAQRLGCETMQIFTRSPRVWKMVPPSSDEISVFKELRKKINLNPLVVHAPYLPNLATFVTTLYIKSKNLLRDDLILSEKLGAEYLVIHPGSYSENANARQGISNIADAINEVLAGTDGKTMILLENVAGGGRRLGSTFQELREIIELVKNKKRLGICFDTAHAFASGYDLKTRKGIDDTLKEFDSVIGLGKLKVIHFNDSLVPRYSKKDRHEHIGKGHIGSDGFKYLIKCLKNKVEAGILETPKDSDNADSENLSNLFNWRN